MPGSAFPTLPNFAFAEKPLASSKLNDLVNALAALKTWTAAGDLLYGYDADQLEKLVKPGSPGYLWMNGSGVPAWLTGSANYVARWNSGGTPTAFPWLSMDYHYDATGHSYSTNAWRDMPNSSKNVAVAATSTIICIGFVNEYGTGSYGFCRVKFNINGTDIDWAESYRTYGISEEIPMVVVGMLAGVPAGTQTIKLRERCGAAGYTIDDLRYAIIIIPE